MGIINHIVDNSNATNVIFAGGSGGGFASLYYSRMIKNALAVVWNPQTNILKYDKQHVANYGCQAFDIDNHEMVIKELPFHIDTNLIDEYRKGFSNSIIFLQNDSDWHLEAHCTPFILDIDSEYVQSNSLTVKRIDERLLLSIGHWGNGHIPPPKDLLSDIFQAICDNNNLTNNQILDLVSKLNFRLYDKK
jgi:hypothetical protein